MAQHVDKDAGYASGGGVLAALCNVLGVVLIVIVVALMVPLAVPNLLGYEVFEIRSGSMEPNIPIGSVVYSKSIDGDALEEGDIVAFERNGVVVVHRVADNRLSSGELVTKGDANKVEDPDPVPYSNVLGRVELTIPYVGSFMMLYSSFMGKICMMLAIACGVMLNVLASRMRSARRAREEALFNEILSSPQGRSLQEWVDRNVDAAAKRR